MNVEADLRDGVYKASVIPKKCLEALYQVARGCGISAPIFTCPERWLDHSISTTRFKALGINFPDHSGAQQGTNSYDIVSDI